MLIVYSVDFSAFVTSRLIKPMRSHGVNSSTLTFLAEAVKSIYVLGWNRLAVTLDPGTAAILDFMAGEDQYGAK